jgi:hypothetical protein
MPLHRHVTLRTKLYRLRAGKRLEAKNAVRVSRLGMAPSWPVARFAPLPLRSRALLRWPGMRALVKTGAGFFVTTLAAFCANVLGGTSCLFCLLAATLRWSKQSSAQEHESGPTQLRLWEHLWTYQ